MLYSYQGNYPQPLPFRIRLSNRQTRTDPSTFTIEEITDAGYIQVSDEPTINSNQVLTWDSINVEWNIRNKTQEELENELNSAKQARLLYITENRNNDFKSLISQWNGFDWDATEEDSTRISNVLTMLENAQSEGIPVPPTINWRTYDNQDQSLTKSDLVQLAASMFLAQQIIWNKQAILKNAVLAANTISEVNSITW